MKIFLDTADTEEIRQAADMGLVDGVTTNPSLIARTGKPFRKAIEEITKIVDGPISAETVSEDAEGMVKEGKELAAIHPNINVKVPMTTEGLKAVQRLSADGVATNVTLIFQPLQGLLAAKAGATFVSPFVGRLDDIGQDGMNMVADMIEMLRTYEYPSQVIVASVRSPSHVYRAALAGADIVTVPFKVLISLSKHPLTDIGIEKFLADYHKIPKE
ncbi:MAG: fructose-6-phosphate aldolase [Deltaproteobacteria bacterium]|nr:MAG: fructose-6-phosphate aldolase [Deltaproteobacteria bacterium]